MKTDQPQSIRLEDYRAPDYLVDNVDLVFDLEPESTRVLCATTYYAANDEGAPLVLDGEDLTLLNIALDGRTLGETEYSIENNQLTLTDLPERFELVIETEINPKGNTQLSGLYQSSGNYCTQCEAQGFRRITYFQDRPDVMARYNVTIIADKTACPVMLSNGNLIDQSDLDETQHAAVWEDPFPKPSYLFALVAGDLAMVEDTYKTSSGRDVDLRIFVEHGNEDRCSWAMESLKASMKWDEERFGLEYDLDLYNIVAVSDFNMGAMENKSLNVFNTKYVLAKSDTATDQDYAGIEAVIAHEYFHNWTGNRVTCRDWFQLSLKEGLTVFRDQEFSSDMRSRACERISNVKVLRAGQFPEDGGPLAHPVRPESYIAIDNFYTATVYNKGSEVIRMMHTLLGEENFRKGMDLYFERHDGEAVTCDDFAAAMQDASNIDLTQFKLWYSQAGTPDVSASWAYDEAAKQFDLTLSQHLGATPGQETKETMHMPISIGLIGPDGEDMVSDVLSLTQAEQTFTFKEIASKPVVSLNRGFSAPIKFKADYSREELAFLMAHDSDDFARWEAAQSYGTLLLLDMIKAHQEGRAFEKDAPFIEALRKTLHNENLDAEFIALCLQLPVESYLAEQMDVIDVEAIHAAREALRGFIATDLQDDLLETFRNLRSDAPYSPDAKSAGLRSLKNICLAYLSELDDPACMGLITAQYHNGDNMTDRMAALGILSNKDVSAREEALSDFYSRYKNDPLVVDKWLAVQAMSSLPTTLDTVKSLMEHDAFSIKNPNKVRSLIGVFAHANQLNFHRADGSGYEFHTSRILELDKINPQIAARMVAPLGKWRRFDTMRQDLMKAQLQRIIDTDGLSNDTFEMASKSLN
ncbi:Aminopeptidase N [Candidatus Terasakiella magnetica]|uniref:Aminopeptidase N n=1 Tax=Candidatus Terasakiella magnetica TaxID=1867952 RepID=A0A1C3RJE7_9PROT|nr:aminopeptidase N [Candidatus Terasakiella magnetica]SCA57395.1 Aminopeptidase N [Candidatus Terasakiella magnetica]